MERLFDQWIEKLKDTPEKFHCRRRYFDGEKACALGILYRVVKPGLTKHPILQFRESISEKLRKELSLTFAEMTHLEYFITALNDYGHFTFQEIAEMLENLESDLWKVVKLEITPEKFRKKYYPKIKD